MGSDWIIIDSDKIFFIFSSFKGFCICQLKKLAVGLNSPKASGNTNVMTKDRNLKQIFRIVLTLLSEQFLSDYTTVDFKGCRGKPIPFIEQSAKLFLTFIKSTKCN